MDADAELDAALWGKTGVALHHAVLDFDCTADCVNDAAELNETSVTSALHDAPVMNGDGRINQIATERPQARQCPILVGASKPAVSNHVRRQNRYELPGFNHGTLWAFQY